jgi:hypothetical protein
MDQDRDKLQQATAALRRKACALEPQPADALGRVDPFHEGEDAVAGPHFAAHNRLFVGRACIGVCLCGVWADDEGVLPITWSLTVPAALGAS